MDNEEFKQFVADNKNLISEALVSWASTFNNEVDSDGELDSEGYDLIVALAERVLSGTCTEEDYVEITFHIFQINYDEVTIDIGYPAGTMPQ